MIPEDLRTIAMLDWIENDLLLDVAQCQPASSDASFRRYFRLKTAAQNYIVMDAPPERENLSAFIKVAELLQQSEIRVPIIYQQNQSDGFLLLEDFGSQCLLDLAGTEHIPKLYQTAMDSILQLQNCRKLTTAELPIYDVALLERELGVFEEWYLNQFLDITPPDCWHATKTLLIDSALGQPSTFVHRDFHSRNLMVLPDSLLGIIDFQDAVIGPITYDLVSLLRDCYIAWPEPQVQQWLASYHQALATLGLTQVSLTEFKRWFDLMGMQRHLKAVGIFARLHQRDGKSNYLQDIPRTLNYIQAVCQNHPDLVAFGEFIQRLPGA
ncbi:MAG: phosphotransferase [Methylococcaceae bacterium]|jgi:hypothetical protein